MKVKLLNTNNNKVKDFENVRKAEQKSQKKGEDELVVVEDQNGINKFENHIIYDVYNVDATRFSIDDPTQRRREGVYRIKVINQGIRVYYSENSYEKFTCSDSTDYVLIKSVLDKSD